jgi:hypothetical protein
MKFIAVIFLFSVTLYTQVPNAGSDADIIKVTGLYTSEAVKYINGDLNSDGKNEKMSGERIIKMTDNEYWIKNTELVSGSGDVYEFDDKLRKNDEPLIRQVVADYGYILVFIEGEDFAEAYIAGEKGSKQSDPVLIRL